MARNRRHTVPGTHSTGLSLKQLRKLGSIVEGGDRTGRNSSGAVDESGRERDAAHPTGPGQLSGPGSVDESPGDER